MRDFNFWYFFYYSEEDRRGVQSHDKASSNDRRSKNKKAFKHFFEKNDTAKSRTGMYIVNIVTVMTVFLIHDATSRFSAFSLFYTKNIFCCCSLQLYNCNSTWANIFLIFKNPGSRATSVKAEPGSALESNLESNASISLSLQADKMVSPGGFIATSSRASGDMHEQIIDLTGMFKKQETPLLDEFR